MSDNRISALEHSVNAGRLSELSGQRFDTRDTLLRPTGLTAKYIAAAGNVYSVVVSWTNIHDPKVIGYEVWYAKNGKSPTRIAYATSSPAEFTISTGGTAIPGAVFWVLPVQFGWTMAITAAPSVCIPIP